MMELTDQFEFAVSESKTLAEKPSNETALKLYSLYKQATLGDNQQEPPANPFDFVSRAKYDAWLGLRGKSKDEAMREYIQLVHNLSA